MLGKVLGRVLARGGFDVVCADNAAQALELAEQHSPRLALVEWRNREGRQVIGREIGEILHQCHPGLPVIAITDQAVSGEEDLRRVNCFARILSKSIDLRDLRQAMNAVLGGERRRPAATLEDSASTHVSSSSPAPVFASQLARLKELLMPVLLVKSLKKFGMIAVILIVLAGFAMAVGGMQMPWQGIDAEKPASPPTKKAAILAVELVPGKPHTLAVPEDARKTLGISTPKGDFITVAKKPSKSQPLVLPGSTMLDPTRLYRIRARFAPSPSSAECIEIEQVPDTSSPVTSFREIRSGDRVNKGQFLAAFHSVDVGNKKNDLIDAMYQLHLDQQILKKAEEHADAVPQVFLWNAERQMRGDENNINRALSTLRSWGISEQDIKLVQDEAKRVIERKGERNPEMDAKWPRVEMKVPDDGVIVERNLALHEIIADNTTNLFQIARVDRLAVLANVPEDDLPELEKLTTAQRRWTVETVGSPPVPGVIDDISYIIDPNQHTAVVKGHIDNPKEVLRAGQFISATVELPPPADVVEVPIDAVSEDGQQAVVFVLTDPAKHHYTMRRVELEARFEATAFVRSKPFDKAVQPTKEEVEQGNLPKEPLRAGELILQTGVGELKAKLLDLESQSEKK